MAESIAQWLDKLGLGQYAQAFADNGVELDHLPHLKEVAQIGAAIGREFSHRLLAAVTQKTEDDLGAALARLAEAELVFRRGAGERATYIFKHALVQDAAYASLLKSRRQQLHRDIAAALVQITPEIAETEPEILAHHYTEAGLVEPAIEHWRRAGKRSIERSADVAAILHLKRALALLTTSPESPERDACELDMQVALTSALIATKGYASSEVSQANARALAICDRLGDAPEVFPALYGRWTSLFTSGQAAASHVWAQQILRRAEAGSAGFPRLLGHRLLGTAALAVGWLSEAQEHLQIAQELCTDSTEEAAGPLYAQDTRVAIAAYHALTLWHLGYPDQALRRAEEAETRARQLRHANTLGYAMYHAGWLYGLMLRHAPLEACGRALLELAERHGHELWGASGRLFMSWRQIVEAPDAGAIAGFEDALAGYRAVPMGLALPLFFSVLAEGYGTIGAPECGLGLFDKALTPVKEREDRLNEAELHRIRGELQRQQGAGRASEACFEEAIAIARSRQNRSFELRAAVSLARRWSSKGRTAQARDFLAPVYAWFTEGFDTADLKDAKALLAELA